MPKRFLLLLLLAMMFAMPYDVRADVAPPEQPPGSNLQPSGETTQVRMLAETVTLVVQPGSSDKDLGYAHVIADFTMHNTSTADESMAARFPVAASDGWGQVNQIRNFQVQVAGKQTGTRHILGEDPYNGPVTVPWAEFDVTFPAQQDLPIHVEYDLQAGGEYPFIWFKYVLSTGAGWKDSIGSVDIVVQLPYEANDENTMLDTPDHSFGTTANGTFDGNSIRWRYTNLEPTVADNFEVNLVAANAWSRLLEQQGNVERNPQDGESWGQIGKLSKQLAFSPRGKGFRNGSGVMDPGAAQLYQQSLDAYSKAVTLLPNDALWHAGYAELLGYHAYFAGMAGVNTDEEMAHSFRELDAAVQLAPNDPQVQEISQEINGFSEGRTYWAGLTATAEVGNATPPATESAQEIVTPASETAIPTIVPSVPPSPQAAATSASKPLLPICGSALVLPVGLSGAAFVASRKRNRRR